MPEPALTKMPELTLTKMPEPALTKMPEPALTKMPEPALTKMPEPAKSQSLYSHEARAGKFSQTFKMLEPSTTSNQTLAKIPKLLEQP